MIALLVACGPSGTVRTAPRGDAPEASAAGSTRPETGSSPVAATGDTSVSPLPCPPEMADLGTVCVDRTEAHLVDHSPYEVPTDGVAASAVGEVPQAYISGDVAATACAAAGKRLCRLEEWLLACSGTEGRPYPYGEVYVEGACNEGRATHPVVDLFGAAADWSAEQMNDPRLDQLPDTLAAGGAFGDCVTPEGVYDLHGNLHEWIDDPAGTFKGGFFVDASLNGLGCAYTTTAHTSDYHDYSTGFRCCADPR